jgi:hypothetical protein
MTDTSKPDGEDRSVLDKLCSSKEHKRNLLIHGECWTCGAKYEPVRRELGKTGPIRRSYDR